MIVINDTPDSYHANTVKSSISLGYGTDISDRIEVMSGSLSNIYEYIVDNNGMAIVKSTTGLDVYKNTLIDYYDNGIQSFMPLGSNNSELLTLTPDGIPSVVTCGCGDTDNDTAYGNGLEFIGIDSDGNPSVDASSYANGYICGQLLKIKETLNCSWWEARYRARMTGSNSGIWDINNGYGFINVTDAINYTGEIIEDPYN